jgi:Fur family ferric uptake transcriptional regulator
MTSRIEEICIEKGLKMTEQRRVIAQILSDAHDHPDVEEVYRRASEIDQKISLATVYRTLRLFEDNGIIQSHDFGLPPHLMRQGHELAGGRARYEPADEETHHDHLIDVESGKVTEFFDEDLEALQVKIAKRLGFELLDHKLELYARPLKRRSRDD